MKKLDLKRLLRFYVVTKIAHYNTFSGFHHEAYDEAFEKLGDLVDLFIETWMGLYGRAWEIKFNEQPMIPHGTEGSREDFIELCEDILNYMYAMSGTMDSLLNIANDFDTEFHKIQALLSNFE